MALKNSVVDLSPMRILRKRRSSIPFAWGHLGNILPDPEENIGTDHNLDKKKKVKQVRGGKVKKNSIRDQRGRELTGKRCIPIHNICLKIRIGNQVCSMDNATEKFTAKGEDVPEFGDTLEYRLRELPEVVVSPHERKLEKAIPSEASVLSTHFDIKSAYDKPSVNFSDDFHHMIIPEGGSNFGASSGNPSSDLGASPDSEVINFVPDALQCENGSPDLKATPIMSKMSISSSNFSGLNLSPKKSKKGNKKYKHHPVSKYTLKIKLAGAESLNNTNIPFPVDDASCLSMRQAKYIKGKKKVHEVDECSGKGKKTARETRNDAGEPADHGAGQNTADAITTSDSYSNWAETNLSSGIVTTVGSSKSQLSSMSIHCINGQKFTECSKGEEGSKDRSTVIDFPEKKDKTTKKKGNNNNATSEHLAHEKVDANGIVREVESHLTPGNQTAVDLRCGALSNDLTLPDCMQVLASGVRKQFIPKRNAWVLCDECQKWRWITATLADQIEETNCGWTCKENTDRDFADCSVPQEKSNSSINEELELSGASSEEDACGSVLKSIQNRPKAPQHSSWSLIKSNLFLHRNRKMQTIDEVMVCHCKPPSDGRMGCGAKCLNRMLNIECIQGTCPCGDLCTNQQFQKRKYAKLKWFRCGKKGYGLLAREDISQGQFLIEYVGEVLDMHAYETRQREYAFNGQRHFYFMTLNGNEVIDACAKGNLARFINHSCDPNCRTEKWMVNGEVCVGLFALRNINKGEEVTFDYNYVRVFGAAAKKCVCGAPNCHGCIGGDPTNSEIIVQDDSDYEFSEPVMMCEDRELNEDWRDIVLNSVNNGENNIANEQLENKYSTKELVRTVDDSILKSHTLESSTQRVEDVCSTLVEKSVDIDKLEAGISVGDESMESLDTNKVNKESSNGPISSNFKVDSESLQSRIHSSQFGDVPSLTDDVSNKAMFSANGLVGVTASSSMSLPGTVECKRKLKYATMGGRDELANSNSLAKNNSSSSSIRKGKLKASIINDNGTQNTDQLSAALKKSRKLPELKVKRHSETVEEKLNELLDLEGGISNQKDASKGYLKLLFLTAASGNNGHGEAIQSNRDLSMILDALMKTKSRTVLVDIINKNGLQMLHNIMKRYRKDFNKTPILRKLLKVLEHLAWREILTLEHITGGPPCAGVESFKDSMLLLTEHADRQVHHIARNFRDKWIPRSLRKSFCMERDDGTRQHNQHPRYSVFSVPCDHWSYKGGKPTVAMRSASCKVETSMSEICGSGSTCRTNGANSRKRRSRWDDPMAIYPYSRPKTKPSGDERLKTEEHIPPGFSSTMVPSDASSSGIHRQIVMLVKLSPGDIISGHSQQRFSSRSPVSYGVPYSAIQQLGIRADCGTVYPAVPFHPFPPLPLQRRQGDLPSTATVMINQHSDDACIVDHACQSYNTSDSSENNLSAGNCHPDFQQGASCSLGLKYLDNKKCTPSKLALPSAETTNSHCRNASPVAIPANEFKWREH